MSPHEQISEKIQSLQLLLLANNPGIPTLLREIHTALRNDPAVVTLMTEDEIAIVVVGLKKQTMTAIVTAAVKPSAAAKKSLTKAKDSDFGF